MTDNNMDNYKFVTILVILLMSKILCFKLVIFIRTGNVEEKYENTIIFSDNYYPSSLGMFLLENCFQC